MICIHVYILSVEYHLDVYLQILNHPMSSIPAAHQPRLYAGHQPAYASQPRMELGASARQIHQLQQQFPALINHLPTPSMLAPELAVSVSSQWVNVCIYYSLPS